jgi:hypothetical protein
MPQATLIEAGKVSHADALLGFTQMTLTRDSQANLANSHRAPGDRLLRVRLTEFALRLSYVRQTAASVSDNLRWNWHSIAHRTVHYCASLHLPPFFRIQRTSDARQARAATDATAMPNRPTTSRASRASRDRQPNS